jgi:hypothetical protein
MVERLYFGGGDQPDIGLRGLTLTAGEIGILKVKHVSSEDDATIMEPSWARAISEAI